MGKKPNPPHIQTKFGSWWEKGNLLGGINDKTGKVERAEMQYAAAHIPMQMKKLILVADVDVDAFDVTMCV